MEVKRILGDPFPMVSGLIPKIRLKQFIKNQFWPVEKPWVGSAAAGGVNSVRPFI